MHEVGIIWNLCPPAVFVCGMLIYHNITVTVNAPDMLTVSQVSFTNFIKPPDDMQKLLSKVEAKVYY
jgi:hypothetical protein